MFSKHHLHSNYEQNLSLTIKDRLSTKLALMLNSGQSKLGGLHIADSILSTTTLSQFTGVSSYGRNIFHWISLLQTRILGPEWDLLAAINRNMSKIDQENAVTQKSEKHFPQSVLTVRLSVVKNFDSNDRTLDLLIQYESLKSIIVDNLMFATARRHAVVQDMEDIFKHVLLKFYENSHKKLLMASDDNNCSVPGLPLLRF